jgi:hypothetical protein
VTENLAGTGTGTDFCVVVDCCYPRREKFLPKAVIGWRCDLIRGEIIVDVSPVYASLQSVGLHGLINATCP